MSQSLSNATIIENNKRASQTDKPLRDQYEIFYVKCTKFCASREDTKQKFFAFLLKYLKMQRFKCPRDKQSLRRFLKYAIFFRNVIDNYENISQPLTVIARKNIDFTWDMECESAFRSLSQILCEIDQIKFNLQLSIGCTRSHQN